MEFLIVLFSFAALIWMVPIVHGERLFRFAFLVIMLGTVAGPNLIAFDAVIQFSIDRVLWMLMLMFVIVQWRLGNVRLSRLTRIDWMVIGLVAYLILNAATAGFGPYSTVAFSRWLFYVAMPAGVYLAVRVVDIRESDIRWFFTTMIVTSLYLAVTAIFEWRDLRQFVYPTYISDTKVIEFYGRGRGPLMNPIANGFIINFGVIACLLGFLKSDRRMKLVYMVLGLVLLAGAYATLTRSIWVGVVFSIAAVVMVVSPRWLRVLSLATAVLFAGALVTGLKDQLLAYKRDKNLSANEAATSVELRPLLAIVAWEMFKDKPLTGHGFGHYFEHNKPYHDTRAYNKPLGKVKSYIQHNVFLGILVDTGLIGLSLFAGLIVTIIGVAWRLARERKNTPEVREVGMLVLGIMAAYVVNGMFHDTLIMPQIHMYMFFALGIAVTIYQRGFATHQQRAFQRPALKSALPVGSA